MTSLVHNISPSSSEQQIIRDLRSRAADQVRTNQAAISMDPAEFRVAFMFEEMHLMADAPGKAPISCYYYGLKVEHDNPRAN